MKSVSTFVGIFVLINLWFILLLKVVRFATYHFQKNPNEEFDNGFDIDVIVSILTRLFFILTTSVSMEYIARYEHQHLWHSKYLWYFHASHHHQKTQIGAGPSKNDAERNKYLPVNPNTFELNDIFAVVFSISAIALMAWSYDQENPNLIHHAVFGISTGISVYGTSYFIGHDLCAHERGGKELAMWLKQKSPYMAQCADVHMRYHHKVNTEAPDDVDPYGTPYGFWLGPQEVFNIS